MQRLAAANEALRLDVVDPRFKKEVVAGGASETVTRKALARISANQIGRE